MKIVRLIIILLVMLVLLYAGYRFGKRNEQKDGSTQLIENYSFVREIAELAALEANGISTIKTTNLVNDGSWTDIIRKKFIENTVQISVPYTAKYGVDLKDSAMRIVHKDSLVEIHLPQPKLLSFELRLDRMETSNHTGWLLSQNDDRYTSVQKNLYTQSRSQMTANAIYINSSKDKICTILQQYFSSLKLKSICIFDSPSVIITQPKG